MSTHEEITIQGNPFRVPMRYAEGHTLNRAEANALNQSLHENLRNIWSPKVKTALSNGEGLEELQAKFEAYASEYQLGVRRRRGTAGPGPDPAHGMALAMARDLVRRKVKEKGLDWSQNKISDAARQLLERQGPDGTLFATARARLAAEQAAGQAMVSDLDSVLAA